MKYESLNIRSLKIRRTNYFVIMRERNRSSATNLNVLRFVETTLVSYISNILLLKLILQFPYASITVYSKDVESPSYDRNQDTPDFRT